MSSCSGSTVEDRDPGLLPQHTHPSHWLQDRPAYRRVHADGAVQSEADPHHSRAGQRAIPSQDHICFTLTMYLTYILTI